MPDIVHSEQAGEWVGHVWRRKETPDQVTQYYWSLSFTGDLRKMQQQQAQQDGCTGQPALVPDSSFYPSEHEAKQDLHQELQRHGNGGNGSSS
jgi:hypothetical protein